MLENLAHKWAMYVRRDSRSFVPSIFLGVWGFVFMALYFTGLASSEIVLGLGLYMLFVAFHLFERVGLLLLLDESSG